MMLVLVELDEGYVPRVQKRQNNSFMSHNKAMPVLSLWL